MFWAIFWPHFSQTHLITLLLLLLFHSFGKKARGVTHKKPLQWLAARHPPVRPDWAKFGRLGKTCKHRALAYDTFLSYLQCFLLLYNIKHTIFREAFPRQGSTFWHFWRIPKHFWLHCHLPTCQKRSLGTENGLMKS
jgi:hypothetical protein